MRPSAELAFDVASGLSLGCRDRQEDAVAADFPVGTGRGFAVLADGMGGHAAGDVASHIVVSEMFSEIGMLIRDPESFEKNIQRLLHTTLADVNSCIGLYSQQNPDISIMGATLLAPILFGERLYWISVGDSPLFLFRDGELTRLNEDHSMAAQIDLMNSQGMIGDDEANNHPDRNCLTSVLLGRDVPKIDCTGNPVRLCPGDVVIAASDGLQFLSEARISEILASQKDRRSVEINAALLAEIETLGDPHQDNVSLCVIRPLSRISAGSPEPAPSPHELARTRTARGPAGPRR